MERITSFLIFSESLPILLVTVPTCSVVILTFRTASSWLNACNARATLALQRDAVQSLVVGQFEKMNLVYIEWVDSYGCSSSWSKVASCSPTLLTCRSVGWLKYDGEDCKVIIPHISEESESIEQQGCGDMTIPTRAIIKLKFHAYLKGKLRPQKILTIKGWKNVAIIVPHWQ
jgi:hypothetical protein